MPQKHSPSNLPLLLAVCLSVIGVAFLPFLLSQAAKLQTDTPNSNLLVGSLYAFVCILGSAAVFYPKKCQGTFKFGQKNTLQGRCEPLSEAEKAIRGHHPNCSRFEGNRITIRRTAFCAACAGLLVGAVIALVGTGLYFFLGMPLLTADIKVLLAGGAALLLGLAQFLFRGYVKATLNALFVVGSFVTLVTADLLGKSLLVDLYVVGLIVFLLVVRIQISEWNNRRICLNCDPTDGRVS